MKTPRVCPAPEPDKLDCPLEDFRVFHQPSEVLRRAILTERKSYADLAALVRSEAQASRPPRAALPPAPEPVFSPFLDQKKKENTP